MWFCSELGLAILPTGENSQSGLPLALLPPQSEERGRNARKTTALRTSACMSNENRFPIQWKNLPFDERVG